MQNYPGIPNGDSASSALFTLSGYGLVLVLVSFALLVSLALQNSLGNPARYLRRALFRIAGNLIDPKVLLNNLPLLGWMLLLIVAGKFLVWTTVVWLFRYPLRTGIAVAAGLTQIGELSFVVVQVARSSELVTEKVFSAVIAASLISILLNVFLVRGVFAWIGKEPPKQARTDFAERSAHGDPRGEMAAQQASLA